MDPARRHAIRANVLSAFEEIPDGFGRYVVRGELGRGGMGVVYDAFDPELDRPVALKVLLKDITAERDPDVGARNRSRFLEEIRATSRIFHPNLVSILDVGVHTSEQEAVPFYVMERIDGPSLAEHMAQAEALGRGEALSIAAAVARGLSAVHALGIVHRDLKPANILLPVGGEPKVTDFGLCHSTRAATPNSSADYVCGSAHYLAPEQLASGEVSPATDLFALGAILVTALTGREPFMANSLEEHLGRVLTDEPDGLSEIDADLRPLFASLMAKNPDDRPASASAVAKQLEELAAEGADTAAGHDPAPRRHGPRRPRLRLIQGGALLALLLVGAAVLVKARNDLVELAVAVDRQWVQIANQRQRQAELIPQLSDHLDRHIAYERDSIDQLLVGTAGSGGETGAGQVFDERLSRALVLAGNMPALRADRHFMMLSHEISGTLNRIAVEQQRYDEAVAQLNQRLDQYPWKWVAGGLGGSAYYQDRGIARETNESSGLGG